MIKTTNKLLKHGRCRANYEGSLELTKSGIYLARLTINGKRLSKSTGTKIKAEAEQFLKDWSEPFRLRDKIKSKQLLQLEIDSTKETLKELNSDKNKVMVEDGFDAYLMKPNVEDQNFKTIYEMRQVYNRFVKWLSEHHHEVRVMADLEHLVIEEYLAEIKQTKSASRYNRIFKTLRSIWKQFAVEEPFKEFKLQKELPSAREPLSVEDIDKIFAYLEEHPMYEGELLLTFKIALSTGMRSCDVCNLKWDELDLDGGWIHKTPIKTARIGTQIHVPMIPSLKELLINLSKHKTDDEYVLPIACYKHSTRTFNNDVHKVLTRCGITTTKKVKNGYQFVKSFHSSRHVWISWLAMHGVPKELIAHVAGHTKYLQTMDYIHPSQERFHELMSGMPDFLTDYHGSSNSTERTEKPIQLSDDMMKLIDLQRKDGETIEECIKRMFSK